jgi:6-phosphogluconate dehydrogenase
MKIAVVGLGKMGMQIVRKLRIDSHQVIAFDRSEELINSSIEFGAIAAMTKDEVINKFENDPVIIWLMIPSEVIGSEITNWLEILPKNSILIDGGNTDFRETKKQYEEAKDKEVSLLDVGTSGGVWGYQNGFSMMVGGDEQSYLVIEPILKSLAKPEGMYKYFGESGAGHFVKMVHNAIEYGMMESLAEGYRLLKEGPYKNLDLYSAGEVWQHHSVITSWLNELTRDVLKENPELEGIEGQVSESGEARWALEVAKEYNIDAPSIQASFDVRLNSQKGEINFATKLLAAMRNAFGGHKVNK